jgi:hypothetical protein
MSTFVAESNFVAQYHKGSYMNLKTTNTFPWLFMTVSSIIATLSLQRSKNHPTVPFSDVSPSHRIIYETIKVIFPTSVSLTLKDFPNMLSLLYELYAYGYDCPRYVSLVLSIQYALSKLNSITSSDFTNTADWRLIYLDFRLDMHVFLSDLLPLFPSGLACTTYQSPVSILLEQICSYLPRLYPDLVVFPPSTEISGSISFDLTFLAKILSLSTIKVNAFSHLCSYDTKSKQLVAKRTPHPSTRSHQCLKISNLADPRFNAHHDNFQTLDISFFPNGKNKVTIPVNPCLAITEDIDLASLSYLVTLDCNAPTLSLLHIALTILTEANALCESNSNAVEYHEDTIPTSVLINKIFSIASSHASPHTNNTLPLRASVQILSPFLYRLLASDHHLFFSKIFCLSIPCFFGSDLSCNVKSVNLILKWATDVSLFYLSRNNNLNASSSLAPHILSLYPGLSMTCANVVRSFLSDFEVPEMVPDQYTLLSTQLTKLHPILYGLLCFSSNKFPLSSPLCMEYSAFTRPTTTRSETSQLARDYSSALTILVNEHNLYVLGKSYPAYRQLRQYSSNYDDYPSDNDYDDYAIDSAGNADI